MLKDMDCQRVPVEGNGHGDGGSFLHRLVMRLYGGEGSRRRMRRMCYRKQCCPRSTCLPLHGASPSCSPEKGGSQCKYTDQQFALCAVE